MDQVEAIGYHQVAKSAITALTLDCRILGNPWSQERTSFGVNSKERSCLIRPTIVSSLDTNDIKSKLQIDVVW